MARVEIQNTEMKSKLKLEDIPRLARERPRQLIKPKPMPSMTDEERREFVRKIIEEHYDVLKALGSR